MKVPKPPKGNEPKLVYVKDRNFTRRNVKGAAGGMKGVDYEDTGRLAPHEKEATVGEGANRDLISTEIPGDAAALVAKERAEDDSPLGAPKDEDELVLDDEDSMTRDAKANERDKYVVARDRMTIDKNAPKLVRRRKPWDEEDDEEDEDEWAEAYGNFEEPEEIDPLAIAEAIASADDAPQRRGHLFARSSDVCIGDPSLVDPEEIRARLGAPRAYAKHCMILAEAFQTSTGARRDEVIRYFGTMFAALGDRRYARAALREFGPGTGIIDVYPLEVLEHLLYAYPGLLPKVGFGRLFNRNGPRRIRVRINAGQPKLLSYSTDIKIRGFAIKGGGCPGYHFGPSEEEGKYILRIDSPGTYQLLVSGITRSGYAILDQLAAAVSSTQIGFAGPRPMRALPPRAQAKIDAWPIPTPPRIDYRALLEEEEKRAEEDDDLLSSGTLLSMEQMGKLRNAKASYEDDDFTFIDAEEPEDLLAMDTGEWTRTESLTPEEMESLSRAEESLLKMAVMITMDESDRLDFVDQTHPEGATFDESTVLEAETLTDVPTLSDD